MKITYTCTRCQQVNRAEIEGPPRALVCSGCGLSVAPPAAACDGASVRRCLVCPSEELYVRKAFPQRLGVAIVAMGFLASSAAWYYREVYWTFGILFATALCDLLLYWLVGDCLMCYRCGAQYRGAGATDGHGAFSLETHERYRQEAARRASRS